MKEKTKKAVFFMAILFVVITSQFVQAESFLYWTETTNQRIERSTLHGTLKELVVNRHENTFLSDLVADHASGHLYWTGGVNIFGGTVWFIRRANLDGTNQVTLLSSRDGFMNQPSNLALDVAAGKMYWTDDNGIIAGIFRSNLDGSFPEKVVDFIALRSNYGSAPGQNNEFTTASGLVLDLQRGKGSSSYHVELKMKRIGAAIK